MGKGIWPIAVSGGGAGEPILPIFRDILASNEVDALTRIIEEEERQLMLEALGG